MAETVNAQNIDQAPACAPFPGRPLVSVVLPVYNRGRFAADAIRSILAQSYSHLELIVVVDEGSTDDSAEVVRHLASGDPRVRPLFLSHGSQWRARNAGVAMARGEYVAHLDDDDVALPERLAVQLDYMRRTGVDICGSCLSTFGAKDRLMWFPETHQAICHELLFRIVVFLPAVLMRAEIARSHPYDETLTFSDYEWLTRVAPRYRFGNVPRILLKCRYHADQIHVHESAGFVGDQRRFARPYFQTLFPETPPEDFTLFEKLQYGGSFANLAELEQVGIWLVRLAQTPDPFLRRGMAARWRVACLREAHRGLPVFRLYRRTAPLFGTPPTIPPWQLWLACACRIRPNRWAWKIVVWLRRMTARSEWANRFARKTPRPAPPSRESEP